jgi:DNA repair exonuclease SbcCD ATPase subunit
MLNSENNRLVDSKRKNEILLADKQSELAGFANIDYASIENELASVESEITAEQARIDGLSKEDVKKSLLNKINKLELEHQSLSTADSMKKVSISGKVSSLSMSVALLEQQGINIEKNLEVFKKDYNQLKVSEFDERKTICPTCHQPLQQEGIDKLKATWQEEKDKKLASLKETALSIKKNYEQIKEEYAEKKTILETAKQELSDFKTNPRIAELETEIATLQAEFDKTETNEIDTSLLDELKSRRNFLIVELGKKDSHDKLKAKIASLYAEQRELVNAEIVLAKKRQQLEQYTLDIISLVNDSINSHFDGVKFKLFEELTATASKNIRECCTITHNGIEYGSCSTGEKAEVNLEIVTTLQKALGLQMNIFVDDGSITNIKKQVPNQIIWLMNEKGKKLDCTRIDEIY